MKPNKWMVAFFNIGRQHDHEGNLAASAHFNVRRTEHFLPLFIAELCMAMTACGDEQPSPFAPAYDRHKPVIGLAMSTLRIRMTGLGGGLNRSTQHFTFEREVECDATTTEATFLYGSGEC
jgi:hypothetical protein